MYHRLIAEFLSAQRTPTQTIDAEAPITMTDLIARYWRFAKSYYVKDNKPTSEVSLINMALGFARRLYERTPACEFSPMKLKAVRDVMIAHEITRNVKATDKMTKVVTWKKKVVRQGLTQKW